MEPSIRITEALRQAIAAHRSGRLEHADRQYTAVLTLDRRNFDALHLLGLVRWQQGRNEEAASLIGDALRALHRFEEALASYDRALAIEPGLVDALLHRGVTLRALGRPAEALECYDRILATQPNFAEGYYNRGNVLDALGRYEEALASYDQALAIRPDHADVWSNRGYTLNRMMRHAEALASCDK